MGMKTALKIYFSSFLMVAFVKFEKVRFAILRGQAQVEN